jgi:D-alanyl-D-alanine carboxypeptidase/D-alanyl-D-alanine-endopeptidase (penicillin-binding protein 4)
VTPARSRLIAALSCLAALAATGPARAAPTPVAAVPPTGWVHDIEHAIGRRSVSVAVGVDGTLWYQHLAGVRRPPASNEKLLLSMALLSRLRPTMTIRTQAMAVAPPDDHGVIRGNLWLVGHGDPEVGRPDLRTLAKEIADAGVTAIRGRVIGNLGAFSRDWFAPGWKPYFPADYVARPTALTFRGNRGPSGAHIAVPELRAAAFLTTKLEALGVAVRRKPATGRPAKPLTDVASVSSAPLEGIIRRMDFDSRNFYAEVLGKKLGSIAYGNGTIANAARAIHAYTTAHGTLFRQYDSSGLSYANRVTAKGILRLLWAADDAPWGPVLMRSLPDGGQGTLEDRLPKIDLHAKTGTLIHASALSGWVWLERSDRWAEFSIVSSGFSEWTAKTIEDQIVRAISLKAVDPALQSSRA